MLKISTDYTKIMPENFSKSYIRKVIMLDLSHSKSQIMRELCYKIMSEHCHYARWYASHYVVIMSELREICIHCLYLYVKLIFRKFKIDFHTTDSRMHWLSIEY